MQVLIFALDNWAGTATLPHAFMRAGADVTLSCPPHTYPSLTRFRSRWIPHGSTSGVRGPVAELRYAIQACQPDFLIPGDESSLDVLIAMTKIPSLGATEAELELIRVSCGDPRFYEVGRNKRQTLEVAREAGVLVPDFVPVATVADALQFAEEHGYPVIVKPDVGIAGEGVEVCADEDSLAVKCAHLKGGWTVNEFIAGTSSSSVVVCKDGEILQGITYRKLQSNPHPMGPATIVQLMDHAGMIDATTRVARAFGTSGFLGPGFMLAADGRAFLTEVNARTVWCTSMGHRFGADYAQATVDAFHGKPVQPSWPSGPTIMIYPHERLRDPNSRPQPGWIEEIPTDDPDLHAAFEENIARRAAMN